MSGPVAQSLTPRLRELVEALQSARSRLLAAVDGMEQAALDRSAGAGQWSAGEILHHLQLIERSVGRLLARQVERAQAAGDGPDPRTETVLDRLDHKDVEGSTERVATPPAFIPTPSLLRRELLVGLAESRAELLSHVRQAAAHDLSGLTFPHPVLGRLDMYQWLLYLAQHELRHLHQIERLA